MPPRDIVMKGPAHLVAEPGDDYTMCGIDLRRAWKVAFVLASYLDMHVEGWAAKGLTYPACVDCVAALERSRV